MSFNVKGLGKITKKFYFGILVERHKLDFVLIQETIREGNKFIEDLSKLWKECDILGSHSIGIMEGCLLDGGKYHLE